MQNRKNAFGKCVYSVEHTVHDCHGNEATFLFKFMYTYMYQILWK